MRLLPDNIGTPWDAGHPVRDMNNSILRVSKSVDITDECPRPDYQDCAATIDFADAAHGPAFLLVLSRGSDRSFSVGKHVSEMNGPFDNTFELFDRIAFATGLTRPEMAALVKRAHVL